MKLEIYDSKHLFDDLFIDWLKIQIRNKLIADIDLRKIKKWDINFKADILYKSIYKKNLNTFDILVAGCNNLVTLYAQDKIYIVVNPNICYPGIPDIKLITLCKMINYGTRHISGYPIFTDTFRYFAENINSYIDLYLLGIR